MRCRGLVLAAGLLGGTLSLGQAPDDPSERITIKGWGTVVDDEGVCRFTVERDRVAIAIPWTVHALSAERRQMNAPRVLREVEGDFLAEVSTSRATSRPGPRASCPSDTRSTAPG